SRDSAKHSIQLLCCATATCFAPELITARSGWILPSGPSDVDGPPGAPLSIACQSISTTFRLPWTNFQIAAKWHFALAIERIWPFLCLGKARRLGRGVFSRREESPFAV